MFKELNDRAWLVGGCVRDLVLGLPPIDIDYVIEKCSVEEFERILPEAKKVGLSFPVYLLDGEEVALARTEKKSGEGYTGFETEVGVSIEDDLKRRDFTINSIAQKFTTGEIFDPYRGIKDLKEKVLRAVNPDAFSEDPLRIYRFARFSARFSFDTNYETLTLMKNSIDSLKEITSDRVYIELKKVYEQCDKPSRFFYVLYTLGALKYHFKPLHLLTKISAGPVKYHKGMTAFQHSMNAFDYAKVNKYSFDVALAALFHDTGKGVSDKSLDPDNQHHYKHELMSFIINKQFVKQHRFTVKQNELIVKFSRHHMRFHILESIKNPIKLVRFYKEIKKYRIEMEQAANCDFPLTEGQLKILYDLDYVFRNTKIDVPKNLNSDQIVSFVEGEYSKAYKERIKC